MLEVSAAQQIVLAGVQPLEVVQVPLGPHLLGRILAEAVIAPRDIPAFDKSLRDGYAVRSQDCQAETVMLQVVGEIAAGAAPGATVKPGECQRIYTGAPMPEGADAVVMQEEVERIGATQVRLRGGTVRPGQWVYPRGQEMRAGETIVPAGSRLTAATLGVLASLGRSRLSVIASPRVGIVSTGNELLELSQPWRAGKIYNSNGPLLAALLTRLPLEVTDYGILPDEEAALRTGLQRMLQECHVLVIAGGMSVGDYDLVPRVLRSLGLVEQVRQVRMKPGKPFLFGHCGSRTIFGLPGNPVSTFVCYHLLVEPALRRMLGYAPGACYPPLRSGRLQEELVASHDRPTYHPAVWDWQGAEAVVRPLPWSGAPDLRALLAANALLVLPAGEVRYAPGETVPLIPLEEC
jgi:molybdopterin molybdotransferase